MHTECHTAEPGARVGLDIIRPWVRNQGKLLLNKWLVGVALYNHRPCKSSIKLSRAQSWSWGCSDSQGVPGVWSMVCAPQGELLLLQGDSCVPGWWNPPFRRELMFRDGQRGRDARGAEGAGLGRAEPCRVIAAQAAQPCAAAVGINAILKRSQPEKLPKCF